MPNDALAVIALIGLVLLPGLTIVRSSWVYVPFLSLGFWLVTWLLPMGGGRKVVLVGWLGFSALLVLLRLPRLPRRLVPQWPSLLILLGTLFALVPFVCWAVPPGTDAAFLASESRLLWGAERLPPDDGPLGIAGHLLPLQFGVPALAADVSLLSGTTTERAALLICLAARSLLLLALYALARRLSDDRTGALSAGLAWGLGHLPLLLATGGEGVPLAGSLCLVAFSLLVRGEGRAPAVAAGLFLSGSLVADPLTALLGALSVAALAVVGPAPRRARCQLALCVGGLGLGVFVLRWSTALPWTEAQRLISRLPEDQGRWVASLALASALLLLMLVVRGRPSRGLLALGLVLAVAAIGAEWRGRQGRVLLDGVEVRQIKLEADRIPPLARLCAVDDKVSPWLPALTGHPTVPTWRPRWVASPRTDAQSRACQVLAIR